MPTKELYARWKILEICNEATVLAQSVGDGQIAEMTNAAALRAAESVGAPPALVARMQRDLACRPAASTSNASAQTKPGRGTPSSRNLN